MILEGICQLVDWSRRTIVMGNEMWTHLLNQMSSMRVFEGFAVQSVALVL